MLLEIKNLSVEYYRKKTVIPAVRNVSLSVEGGETLGLVGESGCGKSTLALSILRLIAPHEGRITSGQILFDGRNLLSLTDENMRRVRGREIGMVFQDPFSSLNPVLRAGEQIAESIAVQNPNLSASMIQGRSMELLRQVRLPEPERIYHSYPHQISGGQRQRVMIAIAIANRPKLLIADEPTTALDVTVQKEILDLLASLQKELKMTILLVTHHLGIIMRYSEQLAVLYAGEIVERGKTSGVIGNPQHPYTQSLLKSLPGRTPGKDHKKRLFMIPGAPPDPTHLPTGCPFHPRCPIAVEECKTKIPEMRALESLERKVSCHLSPFEKSA